jgi:hypothetical protein
MVAARTDDKLRATLADVLTEYRAKIVEAAGSAPAAEQFPAEGRAVVTALLTNTFDGAALLRPVLPDPDLEARKIALLTELLGGY